MYEQRIFITVQKFNDILLNRDNFRGYVPIHLPLKEFSPLFRGFPQPKESFSVFYMLFFYPLQIPLFSATVNLILYLFTFSVKVPNTIKKRKRKKLNRVIKVPLSKSCKRRTSGQNDVEFELNIFEEKAHRTAKEKNSKCINMLLHKRVNESSFGYK